MLSREDGRKLAELERRLRREDPDFVARMLSAGMPFGRGAPLHLMIVGVVAWTTALMMAIAGWWFAAATAAACAAVSAATLAYRYRPIHRHTSGRETLPPTW